VNLTPVHLRRVAVRELVDETDRGQDDPETGTKSQNGFFRKEYNSIVWAQIVSNRVAKDRDRDDKGQAGDRDDRRPPESSGRTEVSG